MKKIVHILFSLNIGGTENIVIDICNEQLKYADVNLIIIHDLIDERCLSTLSPRVHLIRLNAKHPTRIPMFAPKLWWKLWHMQPDIIHLHNRMSLKLFPHLLPKLCKQLIFTIHSMSNEIGREIRNADKIYAVSSAVRNTCLPLINCPIEINYNGVSVDKISSRKTWKIDPSSPVQIIQIGRLVHEIKGQHLLIHAMKKLSESGIKAEVTFIGDGPSKPYLTNLAQQHKITQLIRFAGAMKKAEIYDQIKNYHILVQPSISEGFGLVVAEALSAKIPAIVSNLDGPLEIVENGKSGYTFISGDIDSLCKSITTAISDYETGKVLEIIEHAYQRVRSLFDIKRTSYKYSNPERSQTES